MSRSGDPSKVLQSVRFCGRTGGLVRTLRGFKKSHHSVPDAVNAATASFVGKLATEELAEEAERRFQDARTLLQYKRKDLSLDLGSGSAVLSAKDFVFEIVYALDEDEPSAFVLTRALHSLKRADFLFTPESDRLFAGIFNEVVFGLTRGSPVERVIDAIEGLGSEEPALKVDYPSDCEHCTITVPEVEALVRFDGRELAIVFPKTDTPRALWESFLAVRHAFGLTKDQTLATLVVG